MHRIVKPVLLLCCGLSLLTVTGCGHQPPRRQIDGAAVNRVLAQVMEPGDVLLNGGGAVVIGPRNTAELVSGIERQIAESPRDFKGMLRRFQETQNLEEWTLPLQTRFAVDADKLSALCDSYLSNIVLLRLRGFPEPLKRIRLDAARATGETVGTCGYRVIRGGIVSDRTGERIGYGGKLFFLDLETYGRVHIGPTLKARQLELAKPVQELLLIVPEDRVDGLTLSGIVAGTAKRLYARLGEEWTFAFTLAKQHGTGKDFKPLGIRRNAVPMANGEIMQMESLRLQIGRPGGGDLTAADARIVLEVANPALARHMKAGTLEAYRDNELERDSRGFLDTAGIYAADTIGIGTVVIVSSVGEIVEKGAVKLSIPAVFTKQGGAWVFQPPKKSPLPDDNARPSI